MSSKGEKMREFCDSNAMIKRHDMMMQQQMMHMHFMQLQQHRWQMHQLWKMQQMRPVVENAVEKRRENREGSSRKVALAVPQFQATNLDRLMRSVTPFVSGEYLSMESNGSKLKTPFFSMGAFWESFNEWSAYGAGVPLVLNGKDLTEQYYVPFLSGIQLYTEESSQLNEERDVKSGRLTSRSSTHETTDLRTPVFQYLEREPPHNRRPLADKISSLVSQHPALSKYRSCDLLPTSWMCVAWYPIYRIPLGPTMQDLEASFLTFHSLSTRSKDNSFPPHFHAANTRRIHGSVDPTAKISLPVFGLASYKLRGSLVGPCGVREREQEKSLWRAADEWLEGLHAHLPDYDFFRSHSNYRR